MQKKPPTGKQTLSRDALKVIKVMGYENFTTLQLPQSHFWNEREHVAPRQIPAPAGLDLTRGVGLPLRQASAMTSIEKVSTTCSSLLSPVKAQISVTQPTASPEKSQSLSHDFLSKFLRLEQSSTDILAMTECLSSQVETILQEQLRQK